MKIIIIILRYNDIIYVYLYQLYLNINIYTY